MARGRKKDLTIPPTRSLVQQRDYRARRAQYVTSLEERCRMAEEENAKLRNELSEARERLVNPAMLWPETAAASSELLRYLSSAKDALSKFNQLVFPNNRASLESTTTISSDIDHVMPSSADSATPHSFIELQSKNDLITRRRKELYVDDSYPPFNSLPSSPTNTVFDDVLSKSNNSGSGGIFDSEVRSDDEDNMSGMIGSRTSDMRSTTL